jgi:diadenylate cyclase
MLGIIASFFDILIVAVLIYWLLLMVRGTRAERMLWGVGVLVIVYFFSLRAELITLHWILSNFLGSIAIFIIVVFQQDIRRALVHMGRPFISRESQKSIAVLDEVSEAVKELSVSRTGGLIVMERGVEVGGLIETGVEVDAKVSKELLLAIFDTSSPLHDGAVAIRGDRVLKAGCILPLTEKELDKNLGTRHRAAVGLAEDTDAVIIVVSEQTGEITLVFDDEFRTGVEPSGILEDLKGLFTYTTGARRTLFPWKVGV